MNEIRTVLCPVDFSADTPQQVRLAADLTRLFGARLVLHHNIGGLAPGSGVGWMWAADHQPSSEEAVQQRLADLADSSAPGLDVETSITRGPTSAAVRVICEDEKADLVVLRSHVEGDASHASVTEQVLASGRRSVLVLHDEATESHAFGFDLSSGHKQATLVPTDFTPEARAAVDFALDLARTLPLELHLLHLAPPTGKVGPLALPVAEMEQRLRALIPDDLTKEVVVHVRSDDPAHGILQAANDFAAACIVMGEHTRTPLRRWFSRDTSRAVLHKAPCPVWYVPGHVAAVTA